MPSKSNICKGGMISLAHIFLLIFLFILLILIPLTEILCNIDYIEIPFVPCFRLYFFGVVWVGFPDPYLQSYCYQKWMGFEKLKQTYSILRKGLENSYPTYF